MLLNRVQSPGECLLRPAARLSPAFRQPVSCARPSTAPGRCPASRGSWDSSGAGCCSVGERLPVRDGSLERWLVERCCLCTIDGRQGVLRGDIHHPPWPLRRARGEIGENTMAAPFGIELGGEPLLHFGGHQDVALWPLRRV